LDSFKEDMSQLEEMTKRITNEEWALKVELQAPSLVSVLEEAVVSRVDATMRRLSMTGMAGLAGLGFVMFAVAWLESRLRRVDTVEEVVGGLGMKLVGTLPDASAHSARYRRGGGGALQQDARQQPNLITESVDSCRATLLYLARQHQLRVVMVTSAVAGEGKTSLSCHLAASLARVGLKTLLIDGDFRNPSIHRVFKLPGQAGLAEVLRHEADPGAVIHATAINGLSILPAGTWSPLTMRALTEGHLEALLRALRGHFDFILIDSSPVLPVADALLIGQQVDATLLSVLRQVSRVPRVYAAMQKIDSLGIRSLGVVFNGAGEDVYRPTNYPHLGTAAARARRPLPMADNQNT
jgi:capsular exopolysaccharide synthesis family protein